MSRKSTILMLVAERLHRDGIGNVWRSLASCARSRWRVDDFDRRHATDTAATLPLWRFPNLPARRFAVRYQPVDEHCVTKPLQTLGQDWSDFTFLDIGAGKGKSLIIAASFGFKTLVGVEFVPALAEAARSNLAKIGLGNATIICQDARDYHFPAGDLVVFFYNPFGAEVVRTVIANLRRDASGKVYVIYAEPRHAALMHESGFLELMLAEPNVMVWESEAVAEALG